MVVLADEILESFFETDLSSSFRLTFVEEVPLPDSNSGFLGGLLSGIVTADNKRLFNRLTDEIGKTIGRHQVNLVFPLAFFGPLNVDSSIRSHTSHLSGGKHNYKSPKHGNHY